MQLHAPLIKQLREERAMTQQHLADACDVSLRTIQRVEKYGNASKETTMGLCSVLEVDVDTIKFVPNKNKAIFETVNLRTQFLVIGIAIFSGSILGAIMMYSWIT
jgi:DNA-binding XRE family transcriptional regulator